MSRIICGDDSGFPGRICTLPYRHYNDHFCRMDMKIWEWSDNGANARKRGLTPKEINEFQSAWKRKFG